MYRPFECVSASVRVSVRERVRDLGVKESKSRTVNRGKKLKKKASFLWSMSPDSSHHFCRYNG